MKGKQALGLTLQLVSMPLALILASGTAVLAQPLAWGGLVLGLVLVLGGWGLARSSGPADDDAHAVLARSAFDNSVDAITILDENRIIACNDAAIRFFGGRSRSDIVSRLPSDLSPEYQPDGVRSADRARDYMAQALRNGHVRFEWTHRRLDGTTFPVQVALVATMIGGQRHILAYLQDNAEVQQIREDKRNTVYALAGQLDSTVRNVAQAIQSAVSALSEDARALTATADQTDRQLVGATSAAQQASTNVDVAASAAEELSNTIQEISQQIAAGQSVADAAVQEAEKANTTVAGLSDAARRIGEVVVLINSIASQTNLLALNATIEAARAGEAGKGFAVVAQEVKNLANQTAKATDDIQSQVAQMQAATDAAVEAIGRISGTIGRMNEASSLVAAAVHQQQSATQEIARNVQQASAGTRDVSSSIAQLTHAASQTGHMASRVQGTASDLQGQAKVLQEEVDRFVRSMTTS